MKAFINKGGKANYLKIQMPDTNEALGAKLSLYFTDSTSLTNWNMVGEGLSTDQSNILNFAVPVGKIPSLLLVKYNSNRIDTIRNIKPGTKLKLK